MTRPPLSGGEVGDLTPSIVADSIEAAVLSCLGERVVRVLTIASDDRAGVDVDLATCAVVRGRFTEER